MIDAPPIWLINRYQLAPEAEHAHFIPMPHVTRVLIDEFVADLVRTLDHLAGVNEGVTATLQANVNPELTARVVVARNPDPGLLDQLGEVLPPGPPRGLARSPPLDTRRAYVQRLLTAGDGVATVAFDGKSRAVALRRPNEHV